MSKDQDLPPRVQDDESSWMARTGTRLHRILESQDELLKVARRAFLQKRTERTQPRLVAFNSN